MLKFIFDQQIYTPGSTVNGKLIVNLSKKICVEHIEVSAVGKALLNLSDDPFVSPNTEKFLDVAFVLWKKNSSVKGDGLSPGNHEFPFEFPLPPNIPSSFTDMKGWIVYTVKAWMPSSTMFGKDYGLTVALPIQRKIVLPITSLHDHQYAEREVAGGLFESSGRIKVTAELPRSGYLLGEAIPLSGHIVNTSTSSARLCAYLIQNIAYTNPNCLLGERKVSYSRQISHIGQFTHSTSVQNVQWICENLYIPASLLPSGSTEGCSFFVITYSVKVCMIGSGTAKNASITFNINVGNDSETPLFEVLPSTLNEPAERHEETVDLNHTDNSCSSHPIFYLGGANEDPLSTDSFSEYVDMPTSPPFTQFSLARRVSLTDNDTLMQPPSYDELFPNPV